MRVCVFGHNVNLMMDVGMVNI